MPYIHFTQEQKDLAARTDLEVFLRSRGEKLLPSGRDKRLASDHSVTIRGNHWFDHATHEGGNAISFVQRFYHLGYADAVSLLLCNGQVYERPVPSPPKKFTLPTANGNIRRVFAYLIQHRRIHREVVSFFAHAHLLYEDAAHHNCVFVGMDEKGTARHAHLRSTASQGKSFRQTVEGSDARYSFHFAGGGEALYVFGSPIDLLSYITLHSSVLDDAIDVLTTFGKLVVVAFYEKLYSTFDLDKLTMKEGSILTVVYHDYEDVIRAMEEGLDLTPLITRHIPFGQCGPYMERCLTEKKKDYIKLMVDFD